MLGITQNNCHSKLCNYVILHGKYYIYRCKAYEKEISTMEFLSKLKQYIYIEREIAIIKDKVNDFDKVFLEIYELL